MQVDKLIRQAMNYYCMSDEAKLRIAINYFFEALEIEPNNIEILSYLSNAFRACGDEQKANAFCEKIMSLDPEHLLGFYCKANILYSQGNIDEANALYEEVARYDTENLNSGYELGSYALANERLGRVDIAEEYYKKAIDKSDVYFLGKYNLGRIYLDQGKFQKSLELFEPIIVYWDTDAELMSNIALAYYYLGKYEEARNFFLQANYLYGNVGENFESYYHLAECCRRLKLYDEAIINFDLNLKQVPNELYSILGVASACFEMGRYKDAMTFTKSINLCIKDPDFDKSNYTKEQLKDIKHKVAWIEAKIDLKDHKKVTSHHDIIERAHLAEDADFRTKKDYVVNDPDLRKYFVSFQAASDLMYDDIKILLNKNVQKKSGGAPLMDLAKSASEYIPLDLAKSMLNFVLLPFKGFNSLKSSNKAKTMVINTGYEKWFKEVLEKTAVDLAIKQEDLIHNARAQEKNSIFQSVSNFKKKFVVELYDNPQKALAYEDACKLMRILLLKNIDTSSQEAHVDECVNAVMQFELLDARYTKSFYEKMLGKVGHEREDFTPGVPVKTSLFGKVAKVVKKVIKSDKLEYVEPAVHAGEAIYKLHNNESDALCTIQKLIDVAGNVFDGFDH
jgi:tetratricopeptide (TPR) repeat protein